MTYYVYVDYTEDTCTPFYVGKGNEERVRQLNRRNRKHTFVTNTHGQRRTILVETMDERLALQREIDFIRDLHTYVHDPLAHHLACNFTMGGDGGHGYKMTEEVRTQHKLTQNRPDVRARKSAAAKTAHNKPEVKERDRVAAKITMADPEIKKRHKAACKIAQSSTDARARKSIAAKAAYARPGVKERHKAAMNRPDVKERLRATSKIAQNNPETKKRKRAAMLVACARPDVIEQREVIRDNPEWKAKQRAKHLGKKQRCSICYELGHKRYHCPKLHEVCAADCV